MPSEPVANPKNPLVPRPLLLPALARESRQHHTPHYTMAKTTRRDRRKRSVSSGAAQARGVSKVMAKERTASTSSSGGSNDKRPAAAGLVGKGGKELVKRPAARKQRGGGNDSQIASAGRGADGRKKKRPRSQVEEDEEEEREEGGRQSVEDELVATIQEHDEFFSRMLDMIPEHLVLRAKEVAESSYASKYMKVTNRKGPLTSMVSYNEESMC